MRDDLGIDEFNEIAADTTVYAPINYENTIKARAEQAKKAAQEKASREEWSVILDHWAVSDLESNYGIVKSWCGQGGITVQKFQAFLEAGQGPDLQWTATHARLLEELVTVLYGDQTFTADSYIANDIKRLRMQTRASLRAKLAEAKFRKQTRTAADARDYLLQHRAQEEAQNPWRPYRTAPPEITPTAIKAVSPETLRKWGQLYGTKQVNFLLNQK